MRGRVGRVQIHHQHNLDHDHDTDDDDDDDEGFDGENMM